MWIQRAKNLFADAKNKKSICGCKEQKIYLRMQRTKNLFAGAVGGLRHLILQEELHSDAAARELRVKRWGCGQGCTFGMR
jgi:hypothetical protein